ncbi:MAG: hypothetical protein ACI959_001351 [Limisphaerales bacterium]|jgi:hypothetical protein
MKKILLAILVFAAVGSAQAQFSGTITTRPLSPLFKNISLAFETALGDQVSINVETVYSWGGLGSGGFWSEDFDLFPNAIRITPEARFYLTQRNSAPIGFHMGPFLRYNYNFLNSDGSDFSSHLFGIGFNLGYQGVVGGKVAMGTFLGVGVGYNFGANGTLSSGFEPFYSLDSPWPLLRMGYSVGIAY